MADACEQGNGAIGFTLAPGKRKWSQAGQLGWEHGMAGHEPHQEQQEPDRMHPGAPSYPVEMQNAIPGLPRVRQSACFFAAREMVTYEITVRVAGFNVALLAAQTQLLYQNGITAPLSMAPARDPRVQAPWVPVDEKEPGGTRPRFSSADAYSRLVRHPCLLLLAGRHGLLEMAHVMASHVESRFLLFSHDLTDRRPSVCDATDLARFQTV